MIALNFGLWWSGAKLSYLRYLTFKSLRHFHPHSRIQLFVGKGYKKDGHSWGGEKQDFEDAGAIKKDYLNNLKDLGVEVNHVEWFSQYAPNFQSDIFRWWYLRDHGGFYLDTDQLILRCFKDLPLGNDFIYSGYPAVSCGYYTPVGVLGAVQKTEIVSYISSNITKFIKDNDYNSAGPFMLRDVMKLKQWKDKVYNAPPNVFYPIPDSYLIGEVYDGRFVAPRDSFALHWYGGHPKSQEFNKKYDEQFAKISTDTISSLAREMGII